MQKNLGFVAALILIPIALLAIAGVVTIEARDYFDKKVNIDTDLVNEDLNKLNLVVSSYKKLNSDLEKYTKYGIKTDEILATKSAEIAQYIRLRQYDQALDEIEEVASSAASIYEQKLAEYKKISETNLIKLEAKIADYKSKGVNVNEVSSSVDEAKKLIEDQDYLTAIDKIAEIDKKLDSLMAAKIEAEKKAQAAALAQAATAPVTQTANGTIYERKTVNTSKGSFTVNVLTMNLGVVRVVTDTANSDNCYDNCPTKSLAQYVSDNGGFAGIHGTYFCPPDYANCAGKVNSYDFPVYNSNLGKFINADKLFWNGRGMIAFNGSTPMFFREANSFGGSVTAALANYPTLMSGGQIVVDEGAYSAPGTRGAIGYSGNTLFAVIGSNISIANMAYVMQALGCQNALNLDGGGSVAMYFNGSYKVGPGRSLPNAIVFK